MAPVTFDEAAHGIWYCYQGDTLCYWSLDPVSGTGIQISQTDKERGEFSFKMANDTVELQFDKQTRKGKYVIYDEKHIVLEMEDGTVLELFRLDVQNLDTLFFFSSQELAELAAARQQQDAGAAKVFINYEGDAEIRFPDADSPAYIVNPQNARGVDADNAFVDLTDGKAPMADPFTQGLWYASGDQSYLIFQGDGTGRRYYPANTYTEDFRYQMTGYGAQFRFEETDRFAIVGSQESSSLFLSWDDGTQDILTYRGETVPETEQIWSVDEMTSMAKLHAEQASDTSAVQVADDGTATITLYDENQQTIARYTVNPLTHAAVNADGGAEDITATYEPPYPKDVLQREELENWSARDYTYRTGRTAAGAGVLVLCGWLAVLRSGLLRRRK